MSSLKVTKVDYPKDFNGITEEQLQSFNQFTEYNVGLTKKEIIDRFESFELTSEILEWLLYVIKRNPVSFHGTGPFLEKEGRIYNINKKKNDTIKTLVEENKRLKEEIRYLKEVQEWREDLYSHQFV